MLLFGHSLLSKEFCKVVVVLFTVWAVTALVLLEVPNLCLRSFLSRRTCTAAAFCGATYLDMKPWAAKRIENKAGKSHVAQKKVTDK